jgi:hypothetical protein
LVPLVSPRYSLLPLVFVLTQFYPILVPVAHKYAWTPSPLLSRVLQVGPTLRKNPHSTRQEPCPRPSPQPAAAQEPRPRCRPPTTPATPLVGVATPAAGGSKRLARAGRRISSSRSSRRIWSRHAGKEEDAAGRDPLLRASSLSSWSAPLASCLQVRI